MHGKAAQGFVLFHPDYGIIVTTHSRIGLISRSTRQNLGIGSGDMAVGTNNTTDAPIGEMPHGHFLACGLAMKINHAEGKLA